MADIKASKRGARFGVDAGEDRAETLVGGGAGEKAGRVAGADLDDLGRPLASDERVGRRRVEPREPILVEAGGPVPVADTQEVGRTALDRREQVPHARLRRLE